jgi:hypothetical protein
MRPSRNEPYSPPAAIAGAAFISIGMAANIKAEENEHEGCASSTGAAGAARADGRATLHTARARRPEAARGARAEARDESLC